MRARAFERVPSMTKGEAAAGTADPPTREWLLAMLRYAVTRNDADQSAVQMIAEALDARGVPSSFDFFRRTSRELCLAIGEGASPRRTVVIRRQLDWIDDARVRRALAAALEVDLSEHAADGAKPRRSTLWRGLG
jgi:hypothetical protein